MEKKTLNLSGQIFNFDEAGYSSMKKYLNELENSLSGNEDKFEIIEDVKSRIVENLQSKKSKIISKTDVDELKSKIGNFDEYKDIQKSNTSNFSQSINKHWEKGLVIIFIIILILLVSCCGITRAAGQTVAENNPLSWFYRKADEMTNWFYDKSDEMTERFYEDKAKSQEEFDKDKAKMQEEYKKDTDEMEQNFKEKTDEMWNSYEEDQNKMEERFNQQFDSFITTTP